MRRHALSDRAFAELGAGRPAPATVAELRRSQRSRVLLMLRLSSGYAHLSALESEDPAGFRRFVADPLTGAWAAAQLRSATGSGAGTSSLRPGGFSAEGLGPGGLGAGDFGPGGFGAEGLGPRGLGAGGFGPGGFGAGATGTRRLIAEHDGLAIDVRLEDTDERRRLLGLTPTGPLTDEEATHWQRCFAESWRILAGRHRDAALILREVLTCVVPVRPDPVAAGISATSADAFGAVAMSAPADAVSLAVGLLHEAHHSLLNATGQLFDLLDRPRDLGYSPWRDDPRPASGILHGTYAYLAVTRFWLREVRAGAGRVAGFEYCRWREAVATTSARLLDSGTLTRAGVRFVTALHTEVTAWPAEAAQLDAASRQEAARLARLANADHYVRWRLQNMTPDRAGVEALAAAWRAGAAPPPPVASTLVPAGRRALPHSPRLRRIHDLLRADPAGATDADPQHAGGSERGLAPDRQARETRATAAEAALLRGDHGTFERAYPEDLDPTGLAIVAGVSDRAEVLVALWQAVRADGADPVALARWLAGGAA